MSGGPEPELPGGARRQERPRRPTWVVVLAVAMLAFGGHLLMNGASILSGTVGKAAPPADAGSAVAAEALARDLRAVSRALDRTHPIAVRLNVASKIVLGLLLLFAVAAVLSWDPRGRTATMIAAWVGIAYHVGDALFLLVVVREGVIAAVPAILTVAAQDGGTPPTAEEMVAFADKFMLVLSVLTAGVGIAFSTVLLAYFGGRKGRLFYGLERQPHHGS